MLSIHASATSFGRVGGRLRSCRDVAAVSGPARRIRVDSHAWCVVMACNLTSSARIAPEARMEIAQQLGARSVNALYDNRTSGSWAVRDDAAATVGPSQHARLTGSVRRSSSKRAVEPQNIHPRRPRLLPALHSALNHESETRKP